MLIMVHTLTWGVIHEEYVDYSSMSECRADIQYIYMLLPKDEFGFDGFVECKEVSYAKPDPAHHSNN